MEVSKLKPDDGKAENKRISKCMYVWSEEGHIQDSVVRGPIHDFYLENNYYNSNSNKVKAINIES